MSDAKRVPVIGKDDRNFRSHYYEKVGFRSVEERKTLEVLLCEDPVNIEKLSNFALRCAIPANERVRVWKIILGVTPRFSKNAESCWKWKVRPFEDNCRFLRSAARIDDDWPLAKKHTIIWLAYNHELKIDFRSQLEDFWPKSFSAVSESMLSTCGDKFAQVEAFYLAKEFVGNLRRIPGDLSDEYARAYHRFFANNPATAKLYGHLEKIGFNEVVPLKAWICRGFAGILKAAAVEKIWDKVVGGSLAILVFVALALVESKNVALTNCQTADEALRCLTSTSEDHDELVAQNAISRWIEEGSPLWTPGEKSHVKADKCQQRRLKIEFKRVECDFPMATVIKIGNADNLEPIDE